MSDKMKPIPFKELLLQSMNEYREKKSFYYVPVRLPEVGVRKVTLSGKEVETPIGPAAGPHTQLAQNILAAYAGGARYFELKTVQVLDGEALGIIKPCIYVNGEAYNTEWSSELTAYEALEEYIKAWVLLKLLIKEFSLGSTDGFVFNMSVGYNLEGIKSEKVDYFIESMKEAKDTPIFKQCTKDALSLLQLFQNVTREDILSLDSRVSNTITLSTMHGCPAEEIEGITAYLLTEKKVDTYLKCNPTLLGEEEISKILNTRGYGYINFAKDTFEHDISFEGVVELINRLKQIGDNHHRTFGIKLTNTFPVKVRENELAGDTMYMSGAPLYLLAIGAAARLSQVIDRNIPVSYSGGADEKNIGDIYDTGICPITVSTLLLKRGGYSNLSKLNQAIAHRGPEKPGEIDHEKLAALSIKAVQDNNYYKPKAKPAIKAASEYTSYCAKCNSCIEVCPNRANFCLTQSSVHREKDTAKTIKYILHKDGYCNECGNCSCFCILGHIPYKEKFTVFESLDDFYDSSNTGVYKEEEILFLRMGDRILKGKKEELTMVPEEIINVLEAIENISSGPD